MQFFVFWYLRDELFQVDFLMVLLVPAPLFFALSLALLSSLEQELLLLSLLLDMALHLCDLGFDEVELFMQF